MSKKPRMGRPKLPKAKVKTERVTVRLTPAEYRMVMQAAQDRSVSDFVRDLILAALRHE